MGPQAIETKSTRTRPFPPTSARSATTRACPSNEDRSLRVEIELPGGISVNYDTSDPNAKIDDPRFAALEEILKLTSEIGYTVVLDAQNKVKAVEGTEKLLEKADKLSGPAKSAIRSRVEAKHAQEGVRNKKMRHLPDILTRPGKSWERTRGP